MDVKKQTDANEHQRDTDTGNNRPSTTTAINELELQWRREWDADRDKRLLVQVELARAQYLLKRIAGWMPNDPIENVEKEARMFLEMYDHHPVSWGEQGKLL